MPTKDIFHNTVRIGLEKEGWTITDDPLYLDFGGVEIYIDLGAERLISAEREGEKIAGNCSTRVRGKKEEKEEIRHF